MRAIATPGHTSDSLSYLIGDAVFVGDSIFMPDSGTARCDFPGGDAALLYASIRRLYELPGETRVFVCHDYKPGRARSALRDDDRGRARGQHPPARRNERGGLHCDAPQRDATLDMPALLYPPVQFNIRGGRPPPAESNGRSYLKLPLAGPDS